MRRRSWIMGALAILVLAAGGILAYRYLWRPRQPQNTVLVRRGAIQTSVEALGKVQPVRQLSLSLRTSGKVKRLLVQAGQQVQAGELLLEVEGREAQDALDQAERALKLRRLQLEEALKAPGSSAITLARARLLRATAARQKAQKDYDKVANKPGAESSDEALTLETAKLEYEVAQAEFDRLMEGPNKLDVERLRADVQEGETALRQAQARLEETRLYAPFAGTILRVENQVGENVYAYNPLIRLADLSRLEISAEISELDIPAVAEGQRVQIRLDAFAAQPFEGHVVRVAPAASEPRGSTTYQALIAFEVQKLAMRPGMGANLTIITQAVEDALLVPKQALRQVGRYQVARVLAGQQVQEVIVVTGLSNANEIQILSGLEEGQVVLLN